MVQGLYLAPVSSEKCWERAASNDRLAVPKKPQSTKLVDSDRFCAREVTDAESNNAAVRKKILLKRIITLNSIVAKRQNEMQS